MIPLAQIDREDWNDLLKNSAQAAVFHTLEWLQVWQQSFPKTQIFFIVEYDDAKITMGIPVAEIQKLSFRSYYSLPQGCYGGVLIRNGVKPRVEEILDQFFMLTRSYSGMVELIDYHAALDASLFQVRGFERLSLSTHILPLTRDPEDIWKNQITGKVRNQIRQARERGVSVRPVSTETDISLCFEMQNATARRHNQKTIYPLEFYENLYRTLKKTDRLYWTIARLGEKPIANSIYLAYNDTVFHWQASSYEDTWGARPNNALMWDAISWACKEGYRFFNFGASPLAARGLVHFKEGFGGKEKRYYSYRKMTRRFRLLQTIRRRF